MKAKDKFQTCIFNNHLKIKAKCENLGELDPPAYVAPEDDDIPFF